MPNGIYSSGPTNQNLIKIPPYIISSNWVVKKALSRFEGLASNPKEWSEMVSLGALNATTTFMTQVPIGSKVF